MKLASWTTSVALSAALLATPASAARWRFISANPDPQFIVFGDEHSIRVAGRHFRVMRIATVAPRGPGVVDELDVVEFDCKARRERDLSAITRDLHGRVIHTDRHAAAWQPVSPDTVGEARMQVACRGFPMNAFTVDSPVMDGRRLLAAAPPSRK